MGEIVLWLLGSSIQWVCSLVVSIPFVLVAFRHRVTKIPIQRGIGLAFFFFVALCLARLDRETFDLLPGPWLNMASQAAWALVATIVTGSVSDIGLNKNIPGRVWIDCMMVIGGLILYVMIRQTALYLAKWGDLTSSDITLEYLIYQMTLPGLAEELVYRCVIQAKLNKQLGCSWRIGGAKIGWGWIITSVVFWAMHAFRVDTHLKLSFYWPTLTMQLFAGFVYGWVYQRARSIYPAMLAHNLANVVWTLM